MTIVKMVGDWQRPHRQFVPPVVPVEGGEGDDGEENEGKEEQERNCFLAAPTWVGSMILIKLNIKQHQWRKEQKQEHCLSAAPSSAQKGNVEQKVIVNSMQLYQWSQKE